LGRVKALGRDGLAAILNGALEPNGMPNFGASLSGEDVDVLYDYISRGLHNPPVQHEWYYRSSGVNYQKSWGKSLGTGRIISTLMHPIPETPHDRKLLARRRSGGRRRPPFQRRPRSRDQQARAPDE
jgi:hypothetical protein